VTSVEEAEEAVSFHLLLYLFTESLCFFAAILFNFTTSLLFLASPLLLIGALLGKSEFLIDISAYFAEISEPLLVTLYPKSTGIEYPFGHKSCRLGSGV
jgi:hypothetical protein